MNRQRFSLTALILFSALAIAFGAGTATFFGAIRSDANGTWLGTASTDKVAFHGAAPVAKRTGAAQAAVSTTVGAALATTAATTDTPYGFSQAQADGLIARVNSLRTDVLALTTLVNELRAALVAKGLIRGS